MSNLCLFKLDTVVYLSIALFSAHCDAKIQKMTKPEIMSFQTIRPKFWSKMFLSLRLVFIIVISGLTEIVVAANGSLRNGGVNSIPKDGPYKSAQSAASVSLVNGHYASVEEDYEAPDPMLSDRYAESAPIYFLL